LADVLSGFRALTHRFAELIAHSKLPPVRLHDLRHGAATLALAAGADIRIVQECSATPTTPSPQTPTPASCHPKPARLPTIWRRCLAERDAAVLGGLACLARHRVRIGGD